MADTGFKIGPNLRNKLKQTIDFVDGLSVGDGRNKVEVIHEGDMGGGGGGSKVKVVAFDDPWYYGQAKTVITKAATNDTPEKTIDAVNKFASVANGPGYIIKGPTGLWYLFSVDLMQQPGVANMIGTETEPAKSCVLAHGPASEGTLMWVPIVGCVVEE